MVAAVVACQPLRLASPSTERVWREPRRRQYATLGISMIYNRLVGLKPPPRTDSWPQTGVFVDRRVWRTLNGASEGTWV